MNFTDGTGDFVDRAWALDEAVPEGDATAAADGGRGGTAPSEQQPASIDEVVHSPLLANNITLEPRFTPRPIPEAITLPQRRPKDRSRGFVRAYAPILGEYSGIDQNTFINFLDDFDKATKASPIFDVINIACFGVGMVPSSICIIVGTAVGAVNLAAEEMQIRWRSNKFLDQVNESLFKPRGLFAMVMTYQPDMPDEAFLRADVRADPTSSALVKTVGYGDSKFKEKLRRLRLSDGTAYGDTGLPACAPLVYPSLDRAIQSQSLISDHDSGRDDGSLQTLKNRSTFLQDYFDRRAQASFVEQNRGSKLAAALPSAEKQFVNRFADPNHPVNSGSIFGLVTGGTWDPIATGRVRRAEEKARSKDEPPLTPEERHDAYMGRKVRGRVTGTNSRTLPIVGKLLKKNMLYLIIVNLPTQQEIDQVRRMLNNP